jgi:hypothetical protein
MHKLVGSGLLAEWAATPGASGTLGIAARSRYNSSAAAIVAARTILEFVKNGIRVQRKMLLLAR